MLVGRTQFSSDLLKPSLSEHVRAHEFQPLRLAGCALVATTWPLDHQSITSDVFGSRPAKINGQG